MKQTVKELKERYSRYFPSNFNLVTVGNKTSTGIVLFIQHFTNRTHIIIGNIDSVKVDDTKIKRHLYELVRENYKYRIVGYICGIFRYICYKYIVLKLHNGDDNIEIDIV